MSAITVRNKGGGEYLRAFLLGFLFDSINFTNENAGYLGVSYSRASLMRLE